VDRETEAPLWPAEDPEDTEKDAAWAQELARVRAFLDAYDAAQARGDDAALATLRAQVATKGLPEARAALADQEARIAVATAPADLRWRPIRRSRLQRHVDALIAMAGGD